MTRREPDIRQPRTTYRPPVGLPLERQSRGGAFVAVMAHAIAVLLLFGPAIITPDELPLAAGAGGEGPAGGGGGGRRGTGGVEWARERLEYMQVAPQASPVPAAEPPVPVEVPEPVLVAPPEPEPQPEQAAAPVASVAQASAEAAPTPGRGGGSGTDGSAGDGPGSGGGVGSGIGTGRGSGVGPGTGGGTDQIYPPMPVQFFLPPLPAPDRIKPYRMVAVFEVDEEGNVLSFEFNESRDRRYNRLLREVLSELRFRPAVTSDGRPIRARAVVSYDL